MDDTLLDLREDIELLAALAASGKASAEEALRAITQHPERYPSESARHAADSVGRLVDSFVRAGESLRSARNTAGAGGSAAAVKKEAAGLLRVLYAELGAARASLNWQSPSFAHSLSSQAGSETGSIVASRNDYKRDGHADDEAYARAFVREYVDRGLHSVPKAYLTSSGMAAVSTVLQFLSGSIPKDDRVVAGIGTYFQNKWVLENMFPGRVDYVDEGDTSAVLTALASQKPALAFFDSLSGASSLAIPDMHAIMQGASRLASPPVFVIDNTVMSVGFQPLPHLPLVGKRPKLYMVESLLKYHEFGFDRVGAGIIWTPDDKNDALLTARMHFGTIIPDASALSLPIPNRRLFDARMRRIDRNARRIAARLDSFVSGADTPLLAVVHPSLAKGPHRGRILSLPFLGPFITLEFKLNEGHVGRYDEFVEASLCAARRAGADLIGGTSFGFDTTRVYVTARKATGITEPYVRISVGTETLEEADILAGVFEAALASMR